MRSVESRSVIFATEQVLMTYRYHPGVSVCFPNVRGKNEYGSQAFLEGSCRLRASSPSLVTSPGLPTRQVFRSER